MFFEFKLILNFGDVFFSVWINNLVVVNCFSFFSMFFSKIGLLSKLEFLGMFYFFVCLGEFISFL